MTEVHPGCKHYNNIVRLPGKQLAAGLVGRILGIIQQLANFDRFTATSNNKQ